MPDPSAEQAMEALKEALEHLLGHGVKHKDVRVLSQKLNDLGFVVVPRASLPLEPLERDRLIREVSELRRIGSEVLERADRNGRQVEHLVNLGMRLMKAFDEEAEIQGLPFNFELRGATAEFRAALAGSHKREPRTDRPIATGDPMLALLRASARVRDGRWIKGAPTHVLADLLNELESAGWRLVNQASTNRCACGAQAVCDSGCEEVSASGSGPAALSEAVALIREFLGTCAGYAPGSMGATSVYSVHIDTELVDRAIDFVKAQRATGVSEPPGAHTSSASSASCDPVDQTSGRSPAAEGERPTEINENGSHDRGRGFEGTGVDYPARPVGERFGDVAHGDPDCVGADGSGRDSRVHGGDGTQGCGAAGHPRRAVEDAAVAPSALPSPSVGELTADLRKLIVNAFKAALEHSTIPGDRAAEEYADSVLRRIAECDEEAADLGSHAAGLADGPGAREPDEVSGSERPSGEDIRSAIRSIERDVPTVHVDVPLCRVLAWLRNEAKRGTGLSGTYADVGLIDFSAEAPVGETVTLARPVDWQGYWAVRPDFDPENPPPGWRVISVRVPAVRDSGADPAELTVERGVDAAAKRRAERERGLQPGREGTS